MSHLVSMGIAELQKNSVGTGAKTTAKAQDVVNQTAQAVGKTLMQ